MVPNIDNVSGQDTTSVISRDTLVWTVVEHFEKSPKAVITDITDTLPKLYDKICRFTNTKSNNKDTDRACPKCEGIYIKRNKGKDDEHHEYFLLHSDKVILKDKRKPFKCASCNYEGDFYHCIKEQTLHLYRKTAQNIMRAIPKLETMTAYQLAKQDPEQFALFCQARFADKQNRSDSQSEKMQYKVRPAVIKFMYFLRELFKIPQDYFNDEDEDFVDWTRFCNLCKCHKSCHGKQFSCHEIMEEYRCSMTKEGFLTWKKERINVCTGRTNVCNTCKKQFPMCHFNRHLQFLQTKPVEAKDAWMNSKLNCNYCCYQITQSKDPHYNILMTRQTEVKEQPNKKRSEKQSTPGSRKRFHRTFKRRLERIDEQPLKKLKESCISKEFEKKQSAKINFTKINYVPPEQQRKNLDLQEKKLQERLKELSEMKENLPLKTLTKLQSLEGHGKKVLAEMDDPCTQRVDPRNTKKAKEFKDYFRYLMKNKRSNRILDGSKIEFHFGEFGEPSWKRIRKKRYGTVPFTIEDLKTNYDMTNDRNKENMNTFKKLQDASHSDSDSDGGEWTDFNENINEAGDEF